jgi:hypothetical protein
MPLRQSTCINVRNKGYKLQMRQLYIVDNPHQKGLQNSAAQGQAPVPLTGVQQIAGMLAASKCNTGLIRPVHPQLWTLYMLTSFAMLSQISAIGAGNTGPGTCHALVYSMYAATDSGTEAAEPSSIASSCDEGGTPSRCAVLKSCKQNRHTHNGLLNAQQAQEQAVVRTPAVVCT